MTRALIADPELPAKARAGRTHEIIRCIGCNACIAPLPRRRRDPLRRQPADRAASARCRARRRRRGRATPGRRRRRAGRTRRRGRGARVRPRGRRCSSGAERARRAARARRGAPGAPRDRRGFLAQPSSGDARRGRAPPRRRGDRGRVGGLEPDAVVVATGARPFVPDAPARGVDVPQAWDVLGGSGCRAGIAWSSPTGAATRPVSTQPRCSRQPGTTSRSPSPPSRSARACTSTAATSTSSGSTAPASRSSSTSS